MKKATTLSFMLLALAGCLSKKERPDSIEQISAQPQQEMLFKRLAAITDLGTVAARDSVAVLILPLQSSCPSCRSKVVSSISRYRNRLKNSHFIVIAANGGRKTINSYFRDEKTELPDIPGKLFLDSTNKAAALGLYYDQPVFYYASNGKVYKKVSAFPATVKEDLREFFSGYRKTE